MQNIAKYVPSLYGGVFLARMINTINITKPSSKASYSCEGCLGTEPADPPKTTPHGKSV